MHAKVAKLWNEGLTASQIGLRMGMSKSAVLGHVHRSGLPGRSSPLPPSDTIKPWSDAEDAIVRKYWPSRLTTQQIAKMIGRNYKTVMSHALRMGLGTRAAAREQSGDTAIADVLLQNLDGAQAVKVETAPETDSMSCEGQMGTDDDANRMSDTPIPDVPPRLPVDEANAADPALDPVASGPTPIAKYVSRQTCQWPTTDRRPWRFCDAPAEHGSYCAEHGAVVYVPIRKMREQEAA